MRNLVTRANTRLDVLAERPWYRPFAVLVVAVAVVASVFSSVGVLALTLADRAQAEQRETDRAQLLACTDEREAYVAEQNTELRELTQARDDLSQERGKATIAKEQALVSWTDILIGALADQSGEEASPEVVLSFAKATSDLNASARELQQTERDLREANRVLKRARAENPVVPPATEVCATGVFVPPKPAES